MAKLTQDEQDQLDALAAKRDAPDEPSGRGERVHFNIDMSDEVAVRRAVRAGLLPESALEEIEPAADEPDGDGDGKGDGKPADGAPQGRRVKGADGWASS